jgi:hypothetical protein
MNSEQLKDIFIKNGLPRHLWQNGHAAVEKLPDGRVGIRGLDFCTPRNGIHEDILKIATHLEIDEGTSDEDHYYWGGYVFNEDIQRLLKTDSDDILDKLIDKSIEIDVYERGDVYFIIPQGEGIARYKLSYNNSSFIVLCEEYSHGKEIGEPIVPCWKSYDVRSFAYIQGYIEAGAPYSFHYDYERSKNSR